MNYFKTVWSGKLDRAIEGIHAFRLPLQTCPVCGNFRGYPGISYPFYDPKAKVTAWAPRLRTGRYQEFSWQEFVDVREAIRKDLKPWPLPPAARFGTFQGKRFKKPVALDFEMPEESIL